MAFINPFKAAKVADQFNNFEDAVEWGENNITAKWQPVLTLLAEAKSYKAVSFDAYDLLREKSLMEGFSKSDKGKLLFKLHEAIHGA